MFTTFLETWRIESKTITDSERFEGHTDMSTSIADGRLQCYTSQFRRRAKYGRLHPGKPYGNLEGKKILV